MRLLWLLPLLLAACVAESGTQCPPNTSIVGQYGLAFTAYHDAGECVARPPDAAVWVLTLDNVGVRPSTLCVGSASDGGPQLQLLVPGKGGARKSDLLADGGFQFVSDDKVVAQGTVCECDLAVSETLEGQLLTGGPFTLRPDGGLPAVSGLAATLTDRVSSADAGPTCVCALPCTVSYVIAGSPL
jgi:hypothetical protein